MKKLIVFALIILTFSAQAAEKMVSVSVAPQKYIVDKITGGEVAVNVMVDKSSDPHTFSPKASQVTLLERSAIYLAIGFPFEESTLERVIAHDKIKATDAGIAKLAEHDGHGHSDPHIWTSPVLMKQIAANTYNALIDAFPESAKGYKANYDSFIAELDTMDSSFRALFADTKAPKAFMVYHPSHSYFAKDYGLTQLEVEQDGKAPKAAQLKALIDEARRLDLQIFIIQPRQSPEAAKIIVNELQIPLLAVDILDEDWKASMDALYEAFKKSPSLAREAQ